MIRVLIVDDEPRVRRCLRQRLELEADLEVVGEVADGQAAMAAVAAGPVDVVVMDIRASASDALDVAGAMRCCRPAPRVLLHALHDSPGMRERAAALGAGYVPKAGPEEPLLDAIRGVVPVA